MTARCPFCEAVHPIRAVPESIGQQLACPCGATGLLCAPNTEPETAVRVAEMGLSHTVMSWPLGAAKPADPAR